MNVLVISNSEWNTSNSFGNTFSNFFDGMQDVTLANIYCREGIPDKNVCSHFLKISEKTLLKGTPARVVEPQSSDVSQSGPSGSKLKNFMKQHRWTIFFWARELIWSTKKWKCPELYNFVEELSPDIIFLPTYSYSYINKLALHLQKKYDLPMVSYVSDDEYSLKRFSLSPLFWINRFYQRKWVKRGIENSKILYVISDIQRQEYQKVFTPECKILTKGADFSSNPQIKVTTTPVKLVYTGNLGSNRWKSVSYITKALQSINKESKKAELYIYSATPLSDKQLNAISDNSNSFFKGSVPSSDINAIQESADILVHAEGTDFRSRLSVHQSFSTKLVDYMRSARAIFAVGPKDVASIDYFVKNGYDFTAFSEAEVYTKLSNILNNPKLISGYAEKAYNCGRKNHDINKIQTMLYNDLSEIINSSKE